MDRIIFKNTDNTVGILIPTEQALSFATIDQIAQKDVPSGVPYKICKKEDIPLVREERVNLTWDNTIAPDGFGSDSNNFDDIISAP